MKLILYTGPSCSLCNDALLLINKLNHGFNESSTNNSKFLEVEKVNIREAANLYHLYAVRIPVVKIDGTDKELGWPFDLEQLKAFVA